MSPFDGVTSIKKERVPMKDSLSFTPNSHIFQELLFLELRWTIKWGYQCTSSGV